MITGTAFDPAIPLPRPTADGGVAGAAEWYAARGVSVAPGAFGTKLPHGEQLGSGFHWPDVASCDVGRVGRWFAPPWQFSPILLACGLEFGVLDIDVKGGVNGYESVTALEDEIGVSLDSRLKGRTPSGAEHRYFAVTPAHGRVPTVNGLRPGVDFKGWGGYVLGPPSHIRVRSAPSRDLKTASRDRAPERWEPYLWQRPDVPPFAPVGVMGRLLGTPPPPTAETVWWPTGAEWTDALSASVLPRELLPVLAGGAARRGRPSGAGEATGATVPIEEWRRHGLPGDVDHDKGLYRVALSLVRRGASDTKATEVLREIAAATRLKDAAWQWNETDFARHLRSARQWIEESDEAETEKHRRSANALRDSLRST